MGEKGAAGLQSLCTHPECGETEGDSASYTVRARVAPPPQERGREGAEESIPESCSCSQIVVK